jgi:hypothetical protein
MRLENSLVSGSLNRAVGRGTTSLAAKIILGQRERPRF